MAQNTQNDSRQSKLESGRCRTNTRLQCLSVEGVASFPFLPLPHNSQAAVSKCWFGGEGELLTFKVPCPSLLVWLLSRQRLPITCDFNSLVVTSTLDILLLPFHTKRLWGFFKWNARQKFLKCVNKGKKGIFQKGSSNHEVGRGLSGDRVQPPAQCGNPGQSSVDSGLSSFPLKDLSVWVLTTFRCHRVRCHTSLTGRFPRYTAGFL